MNPVAYIGSNLKEFQFTENIFLVDVIDVLVIAFFIYLGLFFLKQTRSLLTFVGFFSLILIYFTARIFNFHLTVLVLQSFFGIFLIVLVVVFQDELRRFFEFLAVTGTRQQAKKKKQVIQGSSVFVSSIVQAVFNLAREKRGALIVMPGQEIIERYLGGGQTLDGIVSQPILESIFDPDSSGHDGAVIISRDRIVKFGAHLPLSQNFKQIKGRGTRHSAAIGISEKSDALAIIVSEERGEISIARNGKLRTLKEFEELEKYINNFLKEKFSEEASSFYEKIIRKNTLEKIAAVFISFLLWFFMVFQVEIIQRDFVVPVSYRGVPDEVIIENTEPSEVTVTLSGRGQTVFANINNETLSIVMDGNKIKEGVNEIEVEKSHLRYPFNLSVVNVLPSIIEVTAQKYEIYEVLIQADIEEMPDHLKMSLFPESLKVLVPLDKNPPNFLVTEKVHATDAEKGTIITTKAIIPSLLQIPGQSSREITITFR